MAEKKIAICGTSQTTRHLAPYDDEAWEIWTLGANYKHASRITRHFEMHDLATGWKRWSDEYKAWLSDCPVPLYVQADNDLVKNYTVYPIKEVCGYFETDYFTCSIAYQIALAIYEGATHIGCYGIDLAQTSEYAWQRPSVEYWIGIARGAGIEVDIPECSDILKTGEMYAYQSHGGQHGMNAFQVACAARQDEIKGRMMEIQQTIAQHQQAVAQLQNQLNILAGAEENLRWNRQWWTNPNLAILQEQPSGNGEIHAAV